MAQKLPEKKIPSTQANATTLFAKSESLSFIHLIAHFAFFPTHGILFIALNKYFFYLVSFIYVSIINEYISECIFSIAIWKP
jgi:hypothetical protein